MAGDSEIEALKEQVEELMQLVDALRLKLNYQADRIDELEGNDDGDDVVKRDLEALLPIDRWVVARRTGETLSANLERATYVWEAFESHARRDRGKLRLTSDQVENILVHDPDGPQLADLNRNTRVRVMKWVARGTGEADDPTAGDNLVALGGRRKKTLVTDAEAFERCRYGPDESVNPEGGPEEGNDPTAEADAELDRLTEAEIGERELDESEAEGVSVTPS